MTNSERITHLKYRLQTRAGAAEIGSIVQALAGLGVSILVVEDIDGNLELGMVNVLSASEKSVTMQLERLRSITRTESDVAIEYGAGRFKPPRALVPGPTESIQVE